MVVGLVALLTVGLSQAAAAGSTPLTITTTSLQAGNVGVPYSAMLSGSGGTAPYSWSLASGSLPGGLTLSRSGAITGTPSSAGTFSMTFGLSDSSSPVGMTSAQLSVIIASAPYATWTSPINIGIGGAVSCASPSSCIAGGDEKGSNNPATALYTAPSWSPAAVLSTASLLGAEIGSVSCVTSAFCAAVLDAEYDSELFTYSGGQWSPGFDTGGMEAVTLSCVSSGFCMAVAPYEPWGTYGGTPVYSIYNGSTWSGGLPIDPAVTIAYSPGSSVTCTSVSFCEAALGADVFEYNGSSWVGPQQLEPLQSGAATLTSISCATAISCVVVDSAGNLATFDGSTWSPLVPVLQSFGAISCPTTTFCMALGTMAGGNYGRGQNAEAIFNGSQWITGPVSVDGALSCTSATFCIASDSGGNVFTYQLAPVSISTKSLPSGKIGAPYLANLAVTGGTPPYSWSVYVGSLPTGLSVDPSGAITGTPTSGGTFPITVKVVDSASPPAVATAQFTVTIGGGGSTTSTSTTSPRSTTTVASSTTSTTSPKHRGGYWMLDSAGNVYSFGAAKGYGSGITPGRGVPPGYAKAVGIAPTPDGHGYWLADSYGDVAAFGDARLFAASYKPSSGALGSVIDIVATHDGKGYWLAFESGAVLAYGDAGYFGEPGSLRLSAPIVGMASTPNAKGYWMVASDGGVFSYGDAGFFGSMGGTPLKKPVAGIGSTPSGKGYWLVASDGGIFTFGDANMFGSLGGKDLTAPIVAMAPTRDGHGYWMVASDGGVFTFGDAGFLGSEGGTSLPAPIVAFAPA